VQGWGDKGYARIAMLTNGVGFEDRMSFPDVELNTVCAAKTPCKNGGEFDSSCNCRCNKLALWGGADCGTCSAQCLNGGKLNAATCSCTCPEGFFGNQCQAYVLIKWKGLSGSTGTITASWSLDHTYTGSYYNRRAAPAGQSGSDTGITGGDVTASGQTGSKDFTVNLLSYIPGYPAGWHYVFMNSQGQNEFGASRGFTQVRLATLNYDSSRKCLSGGNRPDAGATNLCPDATWATPTPPAVTPSVPATATPTRVPVAPSTGTPVSPATATPTRVPVAPSTGTPVSPATPATPPAVTPATAVPTRAPVAPATAAPTRSPTRPPVPATPVAPVPATPAAPGTSVKTNPDGSVTTTTTTVTKNAKGCTVTVVKAVTVTKTSGGTSTSTSTKTSTSCPAGR
jgi:hypothetical protein